MERSLTLSEADIERIAQRTAQHLYQLMHEEKLEVGDRVPEGFLPLHIAILYLPVYGVPSDVEPFLVKREHKKELQRLRIDIRRGEYKSGKEAQKKGQLWMLNVRAYKARKEREQTRRKVC